MYRLYKYSCNKKIKIYSFLNILFSLLQIFGYILIPILLNDLNVIINNGNQLLLEFLYNNQVWLLILIMILISLFAFIFGIISIYYSSLSATELTYNLRTKIYKNKISKLTNFDIEKIGKYKILNLITNDITYISNSYEFIFRIVTKTIISYVASIVGIFIVSFSSNNTNIINYPNIPAWSIVLMIVLSSLLLFGLIITISYYASKNFDKNQKSIDYLNKYIQSNIEGQTTIKLNNLQNYQLSNFQNINSNIYKIFKKTGYIQALILPTIYCILDVVMILTAWLTPSNMLSSLTSYLLFIGLIMNSMVSCSLAIININKGIASSKRIIEILNYKVKIDNNQYFNFENIDLELKNINLKINNIDILKNINIKINQNQKIGIFGETNSGKTTLLNLIQNQFNHYEGKITINNIDINNIHHKNISEIFSCAPQNLQLFNGSIGFNLTFNQNINDKTIIDTLKFVNLYDFVFNNKEKLNLNIGEFGNNLSSGQKQRLCIARTILKKSKIWMFDETFNALDKLTQNDIINKIVKIKDKTIIIASQNANILKQCNLIYVIKDGSIINYGTHDELLSSCQIYQKSFNNKIID